MCACVHLYSRKSLIQTHFSDGTFEIMRYFATKNLSTLLIYSTSVVALNVMWEIFIVYFSYVLENNAVFWKQFPLLCHKCSSKMHTYMKLWNWNEAPKIILRTVHRNKSFCLLEEAFCYFRKTHHFLKELSFPTCGEAALQIHICTQKRAERWHHF